MKIEFAVLYQSRFADWEGWQRTWKTQVVDVPLPEETTQLTEIQEWAEQELEKSRHRESDDNLFEGAVGVVIFNDTPEDT